MSERDLPELFSNNSNGYIALLQFDSKGNLFKYFELISFSFLFGFSLDSVKTIEQFPYPLNKEIMEGITQCKKSNIPIEKNFDFSLQNPLYTNCALVALFIPENDANTFKVVINFTAAKKPIRSFDKFEKVFHLTQVGLCLDVIEGKYVGLVNNAFAELHGYTTAEMEGLKIEDLFPPENHEEVEILAQQTDATTHSSFETVHIKKDGTRFPVLVDATVVRSDSGEFICRIISIRDLTELKAAQQKLHRINQSLEHEVKARTAELLKAHDKLRTSDRLMLIGTMAAGVAHEINNPLNTISMGIEVALRQERKGLPITEILQGLREQVDRCANVTKSVLSLGKRNVPAESLIIDEVIQDAVKVICSYVIPPVEIIFDLNAKGAVIQASKVEIEQVLTNLIQNAAHASSARVTITIHTEITEDSTEIQIQDNAGGISPDILPKIFDPFITTKVESGGTGLGLSLVKRIIEKYEGDIKVSAQMGVGTLFKIKFPLLQE